MSSPSPSPPEAMPLVSQAVDKLVVSDSPFFDTCQGGHWRKLNFLHFRNMTTTNDIPPSQWDGADLVNYLVNFAIPSSSMNIAFCCIAVVILLGLAVWRISRCSAVLCCKRHACCHRCQPNGNPRIVLQNWWWTGFKVSTLVIALGCVIMCIIGLAEVPQTSNIVQNGWDVSYDMIVYVNQILAALRTNLAQLADAAQASLTASQAAQSVANASGTPNPPTTDLVNELRQGYTAVFNYVIDTNDVANPLIASLQNDIVGTYNSFSDDWEDDTLYYWDVAVKVAIAFFAVSLFFVLVYALSSWLNWGWGVATMLFIEAILAVLFLLLAVALAVGLTTLYDSCGNMEVIIVDVAKDPSLKQLLRYYLDSNSQPSEVGPLLNELLLNQTEVQAVEDMLNSSAAAINQYVASTAGMALPPNQRATLEEAAANLTQVSNELHASGDSILQYCLQQISAQSQSICTNNFLYQVQLMVVQYNYGGTKYYLCCEVPGLAFNLWQWCTALGWLTMGLVMTGMVTLGFLDRLPISRHCCACGCPMPLFWFGGERGDFGEGEAAKGGSQGDEENSNEGKPDHAPMQQGGMEGAATVKARGM